MVTKKIIHMVQGNIGKRKEININMMDTHIKINIIIIKQKKNLNIIIQIQIS